jgi:hypothetical protein
MEQVQRRGPGLVVREASKMLVVIAVWADYPARNELPAHPGKDHTDVFVEKAGGPVAIDAARQGNLSVRLHLFPCP